MHEHVHAWTVHSNYQVPELTGPSDTAGGVNSAQEQSSMPLTQAGQALGQGRQLPTAAQIQPGKAAQAADCFGQAA